MPTTRVRAHTRRGRPVSMHTRIYRDRVEQLRKHPEWAKTLSEEERMLLDGAATKAFYDNEMTVQQYNSDIALLWHKKQESRGHAARPIPTPTVMPTVVRPHIRKGSLRAENY